MEERWRYEVRIGRVWYPGGFNYFTKEEAEARAARECEITAWLTSDDIRIVEIPPTIQGE